MSQRLILRKLAISLRHDRRSLPTGFLSKQRNYATKQRITSEIAKVLAALDEKQNKSSAGNTMRPLAALDLHKSEMSHPEPTAAVRRPRNGEGLMITSDKILEQAIEYQLSRQYPKAELYYSFVLEQDPYNVVALFNKGLAEQHQGKLMDALKSFNRAIELDFNDSDTIIARANLLYKMRWYEEALSDYDNVIDKDPNNALALKSRGALQFELGRYKEALMDYIKLIKAYPMVSEHHVSCAVVYQKLGKRDDALQEYSEAVTLDPTNSYALEQRGSLLYVMGDLPGALKDFSKAIELNPKNALPYLNRALTFKQLGNRVQAVSDLRKALDVDPAFKTAEDELAQLL